MSLAPPIRVCASCGTAGAKKKCSVCMSAWYCTSVCQKRHWKAGHKKACPKLQSLRQQRDELELEEARATPPSPTTAVLDVSPEVSAGGGGGGGGAAAVVRVPAPEPSATSSADDGEAAGLEEGEEVCSICLDNRDGFRRGDSNPAQCHQCGGMFCCDCAPKLQSEVTACPLCRVSYVGVSAEERVAGFIKLASGSPSRRAQYAQCNLGGRYERGNGVAQDYAEAIRWYTLAAAHGNPGAQFNLGVVYQQGNGVARDYTEAIRYYKLAAAQGYADAELNLGILYHRNDFPEAIRWYTLAAAHGHARAQYNLGYMYEHGNGVAPNAPEAIRYYKLAAAQGHASAQFNLGTMYNGDAGVAQDIPEAIRWYTLAAVEGHAGAQFNLGRIYHEGSGVVQNLPEAIRHYKLAAAQGAAEAQFNVGMMHANGDGVPQDLVAACQWLALPTEPGAAPTAGLAAVLADLPGTAVVLTGLTKHPHFNGRRGIVQPFEVAKWSGSVPVLLDGDSKPNKIKIANVCKA